MNGNPGKRRLPEVSLEGSHLPAGDPPKGMAADEKVEWARMVKEMPWLNLTNRGILEMAAQASCRYNLLRKYFDRRRAKMKRERRPEAEAWMTDEGKRHPLSVEFKDARDSLRGLLIELGGTPTTQARILGYIDVEMRKREVKKAAEDSYYT